jgi:hypothetical protein
LYYKLVEVFFVANHKRKTVGFSFRIDEEWLDTLRAEAERQGISVNALANRILQNYDEHFRWTERLNAVFITRPTLAEIISCCPEEKIIEIAKTSGSIGAKDLIGTMGIAPTFNSIINFIERMGKHGNWFDYSQYIVEKKMVLHLRHELGRKWSVFIANQVATLFKELLNKTTKIEVHDNFATIEVTT